MTNIEFAAIMAELAEASYANLTSSDPEDIKIALSNSSSLNGHPFSETQAATFVQDWSVVPGGHQPDTEESGFSATLFQGLAGAGELAGEYVLAIRGTAGTQDLLADGGDIVLDGLAVDQIIDLYNYTQRLTNAATYQAAVLTRADVPAGVLPHEFAEANGLLFLKGFNDGLGAGAFRIDFENRNDGLGILPESAEMHVTGHSLGGHLAAAFSRLFPELTLDATMVNGAGFSDADPFIASDFNVANLFQMLDGASAFESDKITNYIGTAGWDFVAQDWFIGLQQPGMVQEILTESFNFTNTIGHGSAQMTNALAVMALFGQLDQSGTVDFNILNQLLASAANTDEETFERLVNDLGKLL